MKKIPLIAISLTIGLVLMQVGHAAYGQYMNERTENRGWTEDKYGIPNKYTLYAIEEFCKSAETNHYKNKDNITAELANNGTISEFYRDWSCQKVEDTINSIKEGNGQSRSSIDKYMNEYQVQMILEYCYLHADRPNPVQDLVDKGLVAASFAGDTCSSVKHGNEVAQSDRLLENLDK